MNFARLRRRGWSEQELTHAKSILARGENKKSVFEHGLFWLLIFVIVLGGVAITVRLLPLLFMGNLAITVPVLFALGTCFGLLFVQAMQELRLGKGHRHTGAFVLIIASISLVMVVLGMLPRELGIANIFAIALSFAAGLFVTYLTHWRLNRESS